MSSTICRCAGGLTAASILSLLTLRLRGHGIAVLRRAASEKGLLQRACDLTSCPGLFPVSVMRLGGDGVAAEE